MFNTPDKVTASYLTTCICDAVAVLGPDLGFLPSEVSAQCLQTAGATALLLAQVDPNVIRLIGRWRSDKMLRYLHVQAYPLKLCTEDACRAIHSNPQPSCPTMLTPVSAFHAHFLNIFTRPTSHSLLACGGSWHDSQSVTWPFRGTKVELCLVKSPFSASNLDYHKTVLLA